MFKRKTTHQSELELVSIETLVPRDHLLRKIDKAIDFTFIYDKVEHLYCADNGRPPIDPVMLFKMLLIGYLFGIRSERRLEKEIEVNTAYRWFLGLGLTGKVPDHSVISRNRNERFAGTGVYQEIFDEIVLQAMERKLIDGTTLYTDSTHLKANANKNKYEKRLVEQSTRSYLAELDADITKEREAHGKKPLKTKDNEPPESKEIKSSTTDPHSGFMHRDGKPKGFFYLDHRTVDSKHALITDAHVTPGNVHTRFPISTGSTGRPGASDSTSDTSVWMPVTIPPPSAKGFRIGTFTARCRMYARQVSRACSKNATLFTTNTTTVICVPKDRCSTTQQPTATVTTNTNPQHQSALNAPGSRTAHRAATM